MASSQLRGLSGKTRSLVPLAALLLATSCTESAENQQKSAAIAAQRAAIAALPTPLGELDCRGVEVLRAEINAYDTIKFNDGCRILFDQTAIQQANPNAPAVQLYARVWDFHAPRTGTFAIGYLPVNLNGLDGQPGNAGVNRDRNHRSGQPQSGGHAGDGGAGAAGTTLHRLPYVVLTVGQEVRDPEGPLGSDGVAKLQITLDVSGLPGGNGGAGGPGGHGGAGESGEDALINPGKIHCRSKPEPDCFDIEPSCRRRPVSGAPGGNAGRGGRGGRGADGGNASDIVIYAPAKILPGIRGWRMNMEGGAPGQAGRPGTPGQPGQGGLAGNDRHRLCDKAEPGPDGVIPEPRDLGTEGPGANRGRNGTLSALIVP